MKPEQHEAEDTAVRLYKQHLKFYEYHRQSYTEDDYRMDVWAIAGPLIHLREAEGYARGKAVARPVHDHGSGLDINCPACVKALADYAAYDGR